MIRKVALCILGVTALVCAVAASEEPPMPSNRASVSIDTDAPARTYDRQTYNATLLTGDSPDSYNDIEHPDRVAPEEIELTFREGIANLPPHSLVIVNVPLKN